MALIVPTSRRAHAWMLGLALVSFLAWLLAPDEGYKFLAALFTMGMVVVTGLTLVGCIGEWKPGKRLVALALLASLGSCVAQGRLAGRDLDRIVADMSHFNCLEGRRIARSGVGFGRRWQPHGTDVWRALPLGATGFHELYLEHRPADDVFVLSVAMPDMPFAHADCRPDPAAPGYVSMNN